MRRFAPTRISVPVSSSFRSPARGGRSHHRQTDAGPQQAPSHMLGNQAAQHLGSGPPVQAKLTINPSGAKLEREADRVADQVMDGSQRQGGVAGAGFSYSKAPATSIQTRSAHSDHEAGIQAPPCVQQVLQYSGQELAPDVRTFMESRFGDDFSEVRIHTDATAQTSASAIGARAYTSGRDVVFGPGEYQPETARGRHLLAHELAHVGQQKGWSSGGSGGGTVQRAPLDETEELEEALPSTDELKSEGTYSENLKDELHEKYWNLRREISMAQYLSATGQRGDWGQILDGQLARDIEALLIREDAVSIFEVHPLYERIEQLEEKVATENAAADELLEHTLERYGNERERLVEEGTYESELALKYLDMAFDDQIRKIEAISTTDALVQEDIVGLVYMLDNRSYEETARVVSTRERAEADERLDDLSQVPEERPGFLETAWSVVGCDSLGECAVDVGLTVATAGAGKALKFAVKGTKALNKARKAKKIIRSTKQLHSNLNKFLRETKSLQGFLGVLKKSVGEAAENYGTWLKKDWKKILTATSTSMLGNVGTGSWEGALSQLMEDGRSNFLEEVMKELGVREADPKDMEIATIFFFGKQLRVAGGLARTFIIDSLRYRTAVNVVDKAIGASATPGKFTMQDILKEAAKAAVAETAQDFVQALPFIGKSDLSKYVTETLRKVIAKTIG